MNDCHGNMNTCFTGLNGIWLNKILVAMENFEKCTVAMLEGPCSQHVTGNKSRLNQLQRAIIYVLIMVCWAWLSTQPEGLASEVKTPRPTGRGFFYVRSQARGQKWILHANISRKSGITQLSVSICFQVTFPIWPPAAIFARIMGAKFFLNNSNSSNQVSNLTILSVVTGPPDCTQLLLPLCEEDHR